MLANEEGKKDRGGFTMVPNSVMDALSQMRLNGTQSAILRVVARQTWGYQRDEAEFSISFLSKNTGADLRQLHRELKYLVDRHILFDSQNGNSPHVLSINKNPAGWILPQGMKTSTGDKSTTPGESTSGESTSGKSTSGESTIENSGESTTPPHGEFTTHINKDLKENKKRPPISPQGGAGVNHSKSQGQRKKRLDIETLFAEHHFSNRMKDSLRTWCTYKTERHETYKPTGLKMLLTAVSDELKDYEEKDVIDEIEKSAGNNWKGISWKDLERRCAKKDKTPFIDGPEPEPRHKPTFSISEYEKTSVNDNRLSAWSDQKARSGPKGPHSSDQEPKKHEFPPEIKQALEEMHSKERK